MSVCMMQCYYYVFLDVVVDILDADTSINLDSHTLMHPAVL